MPTLVFGGRTTSMRHNHFCCNRQQACAHNTVRSDGSPSLVKRAYGFGVLAMSLISLSSCDPSPQRQLQDREAITITRMISLGNAIKTYREKNEGMLPGSPGLSWRVHILPLLDEGNLYREFHLNESWNSPHNESLISRMPGIFKPVEQDLDAGAAASGKTCYVAVIGDGTTGDAAAQRKRMADSALVGTAVVVQVETERSVTWTKPDGWEYARPKSISGLHIHTFQRPVRHNGRWFAARRQGRSERWRIRQPVPAWGTKEYTARFHKEGHH